MSWSEERYLPFLGQVATTVGEPISEYSGKDPKAAKGSKEAHRDNPLHHGLLYYSQQPRSFSWKSSYIVKLDF